MLWLLVIGLLAWVSFLTLRTSDLRERIHWLERRVVDLRERLEGDPPTEAASPAESVAPPSAVRPVVKEILDVLPAAREAPVLGAAEVPLAPGSVAPPWEEPERAGSARPASPQPREIARAWLEENGLAWAGGAALALGGLFLVTYAAQRGVFTPPLRIATAVLTGALLLGASEWLKRLSGHPLAAALAAGAGAATLYGAVWASHSLFGLIGMAAAAGLLGMTCFGLLALALRHGEPLALLALVGGFIAPPVTGLDAWSAVALSGYLAALAATGFGVTAVRGWGRAGFVTLSGTVLWALLALLDGGAVRVASLAVAPVALAYAADVWRERAGAPRSALFRMLPPATLLAGCGLLALLWLTPPGGLAAAGSGTIIAAALAALGVRRGIAPAPLQLAAYAAAMAAISWGWARPASLPFQAWEAAIVVAVVASGLTCAAGRDDAASRWAGAAPATALLIGGSMAGLGPMLTWAPEAGVAVILLGAAAILARGSDDPRRSLTGAIWIWTAGAAAIAAVNEALDPRLLPAALAAFALTVAALYAWLRWRGFVAVVLAAGLGALAALISPLMFDALQSDRLSWPAFAVVTAGSGILVFAAARAIGRVADARPSAEALGTGALAILLAGGFLLLRPWGPSGGMDPFLEASLRTLLILVAGLTAALSTPVDTSERPQGAKILPAFFEELYAAIAGGDQPGVIGRWRGQALLLLGLAHALIFQALLFNPLWAWWRPAVAGPPMLDSLLAGFLAPAALLAAATVGRVSLTRPLLAAYAAGAAVLMFLWQMLETRRLFQGATLHGAPDAIGRSEFGTYALLLLLGACSTLWLGDLAARRRLTVSPFAAEISQIGRLGTWAALAAAVLVFGFAASPWWGPIDRPLEGPGAVVLLLALYGLGGMIPLGLASSGGGLTDPLLRRLLRLGGVAVAFALLNVVVRLAFRGYDMRPDLREASLETWTFSAVWGLFGFGLLIYGAARRSNDLRGAGLAALGITLAKIFVFDMSRLDGAVRAASFLAVGALLLAAAVVVRRLSGASGLPLGPGRQPAASEAES